jgi:hypothetical protein
MKTVPGISLIAGGDPTIIDQLHAAPAGAELSSPGAPDQRGIGV